MIGARLRLSLMGIAGSLGLAFVVSLTIALGWPEGSAARAGLVLAAWGGVGLMLAHQLIPSFDLTRRAVHRVDGDRTVSITIDDGPHPGSTPALLDALAASGVRATFFLVGSAAAQWPELTRRIIAEGHRIGNHTQHHRLLVFRTQAQIYEEIATCQRTLAPFADVRLYRPPHGFKPLGLHPILKELGLTLVAWQGAIRDTDAPGVDTIVARALAIARGGRILLLHDNPNCYGQTAQAIPRIVAGYRDRGYEFVPLPSVGRAG